MVRSSDIEGEPSQLRRSTDPVCGAMQHRTGNTGIEVRPGNPLSENRTVPVCGWIGGRRRRVGTDPGQVVTWHSAGFPIGAGGQHGAPVEIEHQPIGPVDRGHPQPRQSGWRTARFGRVGSQPHHLGTGVEGVAHCRKSVKPEPAVEQVGFDPLSRQS